MVQIVELILSDLILYVPVNNLVELKQLQKRLCPKQKKKKKL